MIVVDASVLVAALVDDGATGGAARHALSRDPRWTAPDHLPVEVFSAVRGLWRGSRLDDQRARDALAALTSLTLDLVEIGPLVRRMWELRRNVTGYDAAYVALAEVLGCTLVTGDVRLAGAPMLRCKVTVVS